MGAGEAAAGARRERPRGGRISMEPVDVPIRWSWSDQTDPPPEDWWQDRRGEWKAAGVGCRSTMANTLVHDGDDPYEIADFPAF